MFESISIEIKLKDSGQHEKANPVESYFYSSALRRND